MNHPEDDVLGQNIERLLRAGHGQLERSYGEFQKRLEGRSAFPWGKVTLAASILVCVAVCAAIVAPALRRPKGVSLLAAAPPAADEPGLVAQIEKLEKALESTSDEDERTRIRAAIERCRVELGRLREGKPPPSDKMNDKLVSKGPNRIEQFTKALKANPADVAALTGRAEEYLKTKKWDAAAEDAREAIRLAPKNAQAHSVLGQAYLLLNRVEEGEKALARAAELDPKRAGDIEHARRMGRVQLEIDALYGKIKMSTDAGERAMLEGKVKELGQELKMLSQGQGPSINLKVVEARLQKDPDDVAARVDRATWYLDNGKADPALKDLDRAIELKPDFAPAYLKRAVAHAMKGNMPAAWQDAKKGETLDPKNMKAVEMTNGTIKKLSQGGKDRSRSAAEVEQQIQSLKDRLEELKSKAAATDLPQAERDGAARDAERVQAEIEKLQKDLENRSAEPAPKKGVKKS